MDHDQMMKMKKNTKGKKYKAATKEILFYSMFVTKQHAFVVFF